jgi:hypothetical protein
VVDFRSDGGRPFGPAFIVRCMTHLDLFRRHRPREPSSIRCLRNMPPTEEAILIEAERRNPPQELQTR